MIWVILATLTAFTGEKESYTLQRVYETLTDCTNALTRMHTATEDYWPNPQAGVKKLEFVCQSERPHGN